MQNTVLIALIVVIALFILYQYDSTLFGLLGRRYEGFADDAPPASPTSCPAGQEMKDGKCVPKMDSASSGSSSSMGSGTTPATGSSSGSGASSGGNVSGTTTTPGSGKEGFADLASFEGPANFSSVDPPAGCYPRDQLTPSELLPLDQNSIYAQQNPMGPGSLKGKNFLSAGALIGVNTVGQSLRNANLQLRSEPPNPQVPVSIFMNSTIGPDISHRPLDIGA